MQYVECKFPNSKSDRSYCYHFDLPGEEPLQVGDKVDVLTDRGGLTVEVVGLREDTPSFPTKPIARVVSRQGVVVADVAEGR